MHDCRICAWTKEEVWPKGKVARLCGYAIKGDYFHTGRRVVDLFPAGTGGSCPAPAWCKAPPAGGERRENSE